MNAKVQCHPPAFLNDQTPCVDVGLALVNTNRSLPKDFLVDFDRFANVLTLRILANILVVNPPVPWQEGATRMWIVSSARTWNCASTCVVCIACAKNIPACGVYGVACASLQRVDPVLQLVGTSAAAGRTVQQTAVNQHVCMHHASVVCFNSFLAKEGKIICKESSSPVRCNFPPSIDHGTASCLGFHEQPPNPQCTIMIRHERVHYNRGAMWVLHFTKQF